MADKESGIVSVWLIRTRELATDTKTMVLEQLCGVEYADLDAGEVMSGDVERPLDQLVKPISFGSSFLNDVTKAAGKLGIEKAFGVLVQFDFKYDPKRARKPVAKDPQFLGVFGWHE